MKISDGRATYALLMVPLVLGSALVWLVTSSASAAASGNELEGALFMMAFVGAGVTLVLPPLVVAIAVYALRAYRTSFPVFLACVLTALAPVAYFQCVNLESGFLLAALSNGYPILSQAYPTLVAEALAIFCGAVGVISYGIYRLVRSRNVPNR